MSRSLRRFWATVDLTSLLLLPSQQQPSVKIIDVLLTVGLDTSDRWVLRRVMNYARMKTRQLDYGALSKILNCAARTADKELAMEAIAAMEAAHYELSYMDLRATILATTRAQDDAAAVSALMEMENRCGDLCADVVLRSPSSSHSCSVLQTGAWCPTGR